MKKQSSYLVLLLSLFIAFLFYFVILYLQTQRNLYIGIVIFWTVLLPVVSAIPFSFVYIVSLPSPIFGTWLLVTIIVEKYIVLSLPFRLVTSCLSVLLVFVFHILTRKRTMIWKFPMASVSRASIAAMSVLFFAFGVMLLNPSAYRLDTPSELFYFSVTSLGYIATSMIYVNSSYRRFALSNKLNALYLENAVSKIWEAIEKKHPNHQRDSDLLRYYVEESIRCFFEGDFEKSFIWGYKVIREKTIVDPLEYVNDKREHEPSFSDIRETLMHSRRKGKHTSPTKIRQITRVLFKDCLDLLEREFSFLNRISEQRREKQEVISS